MGYFLKLVHYRFLTIKTLIELAKIGENLPDSVSEWIKEDGKVLAVFNVSDGICLQMYCRTLMRKKFITVNNGYSMPYGIGMLMPNFRFGIPLVICEGLADRDFLAYCYPNVVAMGNKRTTLIQMQTIKALTDNVILAYDNDATGQSSFYTDKKKFEEMGFQVSWLRHLGKDPGEVVDFAMKGDMVSFNHCVNRYKQQIRSLCRK